MTTTIQAEINLPSDIFEYRGTFFRLSRTVEGRRKELSEAELTSIKKRLTAVVDNALSKGIIDISQVGSFDLNTDNRTFYVYRDKNGPWNGSHSDKFVRIEQAVIDAFTGVNTSSNPTTPNVSGGGLNPKKSTNDASSSASDFKAAKDMVRRNFETPTSKIEASSLATIAKILENKHSSQNNKIRILDPVIIQNLDNFRSHKKLIHAVETFNANPSLKTLYIPIHIGSSKGHRDGHWICAALTRQKIEHKDKNLYSPTAIVYNSFGSDTFIKNLTEFLSDAIEAEYTAIPADNISHQSNGYDCGVHVLHFIKTMEETHFSSLINYMQNRSYKVNIPKARSDFVKMIQKEAKDDLLQGDIAKYDLWTVKDEHLSKTRDKFIGATELKKIHKAQLEEFRKDIDAIEREHFDWWTFPIKKSSRGFKELYAVNDESIEELKRDSEFMRNYIESTQFVLAAYGWELKSQAEGYIIEPFKGREQKAIPEIRLAKMAESFHLFNEDLHKALVQLSENQTIIGNAIQNTRAKKAFGSGGFLGLF